MSMTANFVPVSATTHVLEMPLGSLRWQWRPKEPRLVLSMSEKQHRDFLEQNRDNPLGLMTNSIWNLGDLLKKLDAHMANKSNNTIISEVAEVRVKAAMEVPTAEGAAEFIAAINSEFAPAAADETKAQMIENLVKGMFGKIKFFESMDPHMIQDLVKLEKEEELTKVVTFFVDNNVFGNPISSDEFLKDFSNHAGFDASVEELRVPTVKAFISVIKQSLSLLPSEKQSKTAAPMPTAPTRKRSPRKPAEAKV